MNKAVGRRVLDRAACPHTIHIVWQTECPMMVGKGQSYAMVE